MRTKEYLMIGGLLLMLGLAIVLPLVKAVSPTGASVAAGTPQTAPNDTAGTDLAFAGNVTYLGITAYSTTQAWQGYFGNVSGTIQLADNNDYQIYNWTLAEPQGEVYSSTNSTIIWTNMQCFNFTANGSSGLGTPGATNLAGTNLSTLETRFNISSDDVDGVNETFFFTPASDGHDLFYTANLQFSAGECLSAKLFDSTGASVANNFEEVLLFEPATASVVFASILEEGTLNGFNQEDNDFQMLVLENGHGTDTSATTYYFFVELE